MCCCVSRECCMLHVFAVDGSTHDKQRGDCPQQLSHSPVLQSVWRAIRFHLGTIAIAALLMAIIQFIRAVIKYIETVSEATEAEWRFRLCLLTLLRIIQYCSMR